MTLVKPQPPADLWERLDRELQVTKPKDSFTVWDFVERYKVSASTARLKLSALIKAGKVKRYGSGNSFYYTLAEGA